MHSSLKWKTAVWHKLNNVLCTIYIKTIMLRTYIFVELLGPLFKIHQYNLLYTYIKEDNIFFLQYMSIVYEKLFDLKIVISYWSLTPLH